VVLAIHLNTPLFVNSKQNATNEMVDNDVTNDN
jgi:hypothetical protein